MAAFAHVSLLLGYYEETKPVATRIIEIVPLAPLPHLILGEALLLQDWYTDADESLRRAVTLEADLPEAHYGIGLAAIALGNNTGAQIQPARLTELDWRLAGKLMEHRKRDGFTPTEVINCLFEIDTDVRIKRDKQPK